MMTLDINVMVEARKSGSRIPSAEIRMIREQVLDHPDYLGFIGLNGCSRAVALKLVEGQNGSDYGVIVDTSGVGLVFDVEGSLRTMDFKHVYADPDNHQMLVGPEYHWQLKVCPGEDANVSRYIGKMMSCSGTVEALLFKYSRGTPMAEFAQRLTKRHIENCD